MSWPCRHSWPPCLFQLSEVPIAGPSNPKRNYSSIHPDESGGLLRGVRRYGNDLDMRSVFRKGSTRYAYSINSADDFALRGEAEALVNAVTGIIRTINQVRTDHVSNSCTFKLCQRAFNDFMKTGIGLLIKPSHSLIFFFFQAHLTERRCGKFPAACRMPMVRGAERTQEEHRLHSSMHPFCVSGRRQSFDFTSPICWDCGPPASHFGPAR